MAACSTKILWCAVEKAFHAGRCCGQIKGANASDEYERLRVEIDKWLNPDPFITINNTKIPVVNVADIEFKCK